MRSGAVRRSSALMRAISSCTRERLRDVVVGAGRQAADAVGLLAARGQQDDRQALRLGAIAQAPAQLDAGDLRDHPVEDREIEALLRQKQLGLLAVGGMHDVEAFRFEIVLAEARPEALHLRRR